VARGEKLTSEEKKRMEELEKYFMSLKREELRKLHEKVARGEKLTSEE
jgi:hypothetical protein